MSTTGAALDPDAMRYRQHWQPVLAPAVRRLIDRVAADLAPGSIGRPGAPRAGDGASQAVILDVGAGTGSLSLAAAERWPEARITGLDASAAMLAVARRRASETGAGSAAGIDWLTADAAAMPLPSALVDVVLSSFMLQLVDDRAAVLREIARVLRPGGRFGFVTWIVDDEPMEADVEFDEAVYDLAIDDPDSDADDRATDDFESLEQARGELVAAGFSDIDVRSERLVHVWTPEDFLVFKEAFDERELFESLSATDRGRLRERVRQRWSGLPPSAFTLDAPLVSALAATGG